MSAINNLGVNLHHFFVVKKLYIGVALDYLRNKVCSLATSCFNLLNTCFARTPKPISKVALKENGDTENKSVYVFGDIHGELNGFKENLMHAGLTDSKDKWIGKSNVMVQMGDVIDRGKDSEEAWDYLGELQMQAEKGAVVRLTGNHELMVLEGNFGYAQEVIKDPKKFAEKVKAEILNGNVCLAYTDGKRLYTHAGLRSKMRELIIAEITAKRNNGNTEVSLEDMVEHLNHLLVEAVKKDDYSHPIFQVGKSRGGRHVHGGALWEDVSEMLKSKNARDVPQVIGHNPPRSRKDAPIRVTESQRLVNVDAGLNAGYGGHRAYVVFKGVDMVIREKAAGVWNETTRENLKS